MINYKWNTYTKDYSLRRLILGFLFYAFYFADIHLCSQEDYYYYDKKVIGVRAVSTALLYFNYRYELIQIFSLGFFGYFLDNFWNFFDTLQTMTYTAYLVISFLYEDSNSRQIVSI